MASKGNGARRSRRLAWTFAIALRATAAAAELELAPPVALTEAVAPSEDAYTGIRGIQAVGERVFVGASTAGHGIELWTTDGSAAGTHLVRDLWPGSVGSLREFLGRAGDRVVFRALMPDFHFTVWSSDGTAGGTVQLPAEVREMGSPWYDESARDSASSAFWIETDGTTRVLWRSDGTPAGTARIDVARVLRTVGVLGSSLLYERAESATGTRSLWRIDDAAAEPVLVKDFASAASAPAATAVADVLFFAGSDAVHGTELWRTDGTEAGTWLVADVEPGAASSSPSQITPYGDAVCFVSTTGAGGAATPRLRCNDGTPAGTRALPPALSPGASIGYVSAAAGRIYFAVWSSSDAGTWVTDGTEAGTLRVAASTGWGYVEHGGIAFWGQPLGPLWRSDGTPAGTFALAVETPEAMTPLPAGIVMAVDGLLLLADGTDAEPTVLARFPQWGGASLGPAAGARQLYWTDAGTWSIDLRGGESELLSPLASRGAALGTRAIFETVELAGDAPTALWTTDGTAAGTSPLSLDAPYDGSHHHFASLGDRVLISVRDSWDSREAWLSDGTPEGTRFLGALGFNGSGRRCPVRLGDQLLLSQVFNSDFLREQVWSVPIESGAPEPFPDGFDFDWSCPPAIADGLLYGIARVSEEEDGNSHAVLVRTDGTAAGTELFYDAAGTTGANPAWIVGALGEWILFEASRENAVWRTDGTTEGTFRVQTAGIEHTGRWLTGVSPPFRGALLFSHDDGIHGNEPWRSDGTPEGTYLVRDVFEGPYDSRPRDFVIAGGLVHFTACNELGCEPWVSDGTPEGTRMWADLAPGSAGSDPEDARVVAGRVVFSAFDGAARQVFAPEPKATFIGVVALAALAAARRARRG